jgi:hypothetical protein
MTLQQVANSMLAGYPFDSGGMDLPLSEHLTFTPDNTYDVGTATANRPRTVYARTSVVAAAGTTSEIALGTYASSAFIKGINFGYMFLGSGGIERWQIDGSGHWGAAADNTYDIGGDEDARPRSLYVGTSAFVADKQVGISATAGNQLAWNADGFFVPDFLTQAEGDARYTQGGITQATADARYVQLAGGSVMTGLLGPTTTNTRDLGTTALRWRKLWAVDAEFTNAPTVGGSALLTQATADALFLTPAEGNAAYATPASVASAVTTHEAAADPHAIYLTQTEGDARYQTPAQAAGLYLPLTGGTLSGNLTFGGTGRRILGDFGNATLTDRVAFQNSVTFAPTTVSVIPGTTGTSSTVELYNAAGMVNSSVLRFTHLSTSAQVRAERTGSGTYYPLSLWTSGIERLTIDTAGAVSVAGNLAMTGSNARFIADWTSAAQAALQTSVVNGSTQFYTIPNGTSRQSGFYAWGDSTLTNAQFFGFIMDSANNAAKMTVGRLGTGGFANMIMNIGGADRMYGWASGKVQILTGPLQVDAGGASIAGDVSVGGQIQINSPGYTLRFGSVNDAIQMAGNSLYYDTWGSHYWRASSAGFATRMTLDSAGNLVAAGTMTVSGPVTGAAYNTIAIGNEVGQGNGVQSTGPLIKGSAFGPAQQAGAGWLKFMTNNTPIYIPYYV